MAWKATTCTAWPHLHLCIWGGETVPVQVHARRMTCLLAHLRGYDSIGAGVLRVLQQPLPVAASGAHHKGHAVAGVELHILCMQPGMSACPLLFAKVLHAMMNRFIHLLPLTTEGKV